ncbi:MAG: hypothetical protein ACYC8T_03070 [Myxococcaceae bacterium]
MMTPEQAEEVLAGAELVPLGEASIAEARALVSFCLEADVAAAVGSTDGCGPSCAPGGCAPKVQILVRRDDARKVNDLLRDRWIESVKREGVVETTGAPAAAVDPDGEPPCPACGTVAPLVKGACSDCGLQLE